MRQWWPAYVHKKNQSRSQSLTYLSECVLYLHAITYGMYGSCCIAATSGLSFCGLNTYLNNYFTMISQKHYMLLVRKGWFI